MTLLDELSSLKTLFEVVDERGYEVFTIQCLVHSAKGSYCTKTLAPEVLVQRWTDLREGLSEDGIEFRDLVKNCCKRTPLVNEIRKGDFDCQTAGLYCAILATGDLPELSAWCREGLESVETENWLEAFRGTNDLVRLGMRLKELGGPPALKQSFQDALIELANAVLSDHAYSAEIIQEVKCELFDCMESAAHAVFRDRLHLTS